MMIGRTKDANEEIDGDERPVTSHLSRVDAKRRWQRVENRPSEPAVRHRQQHPPTSISAPTARACITSSSSCLGMFGDTDDKRDAMLRFANR
ncbi:hypothetical protein MJ575_21315 [Klebsiella pneumoniae]|nr:hypothetical protein MJ575_21315 [Klebsiella pneumoniae]